MKKIQNIFSSNHSYFLIAVLVIFGLYLCYQNETLVKVMQGSEEKVLYLNDQTPGQTKVVQHDAALTQLSLSNTLSGTEIGELIQWDENNQLIVDKNVITAIDYFLMALGELPREVVYDGVREYFASYLPEPALSSANKIFGDYLAYLSRLDGEGQQSENAQGFDPFDYLDKAEKMREQVVPQLEQSLNTLKTLRREFLGDQVATAIWQDDESYDEYTLQRLKLHANTELSAEDKQQQVAVLEQQLLHNFPPSSIYHSSAKEGHSHSFHSLHLAIAQPSANESDAQTYQKNMLRFGGPAAERLSKLAQQRRHFSNSYAAYQKRAQQMIQPGLEAEQQGLLQQLRAEFFTPAQITKVKAWDRITASE